MRNSFKLAFAAAALSALALGFTGSAFADGPDSGDSSAAKKCSKYKKGSDEWKKCMRSHKEEREDAYALGYWLAKTGAYQEALDVLREPGGESDPRVLTMIGFSLRHLGRVEEAIGYYDRALAINENMTNTRQYLGEAFLQKGEPARAGRQLAEIGARCGVSCEDYRSLASAIAAYGAKAAKG
jgi:tetratricopeptide (TPR) repeat protein